MGISIMISMAYQSKLDFNDLHFTRWQNHIPIRPKGHYCTCSLFIRYLMLVFVEGCGMEAFYGQPSLFSCCNKLCGIIKVLILCDLCSSKYYTLPRTVGKHFMKLAIIFFVISQITSHMYISTFQVCRYVIHL